MPLTRDFTRSVLFIVEERTTAGGATEKIPIGTGFICSVKGEFDSDPIFHYLVTARHVVSHGRATWVRVNISDTGTEDRPIPTKSWIGHPSQDVAVAPLAMTGMHDWRAIPAKALEEIATTPIDLEFGDRVYFVGLLPSIPEMGRRNIPMVRSGTLGALYQDGIRLEIDPGKKVTVKAHLIDCRSYLGFSGSPCYVQRDTLASPAPGQLALGTRTYLLGLISAHFPEPNDPMSHAGVGVVTASEHIMEVINGDMLKEDRRKRTESHRAATKDAPAVMDAAEESFTRQAFEDALKKVSRKAKPSPPEPSSSGT